MNICFIAEGSYPYVLGGVSAWIQLLITSMPELDFSIITIGASSYQKGCFRYQIPKNVTNVVETFIDFQDESGHRWGKRLHLAAKSKNALKDLISGKDCDWDSIFELVINRKCNIATLLLSKDFFDIVEDISEKNFFYVPFTEFYWNIRSMMMPLFQIIKTAIPQADIYHSVSTGYAGILGAMIKYRTGQPYVLTEHGLYSREREEEIIKSASVKNYNKDMWIDFFYALSRKAYMSADEVITLFSKNKEIEIEIGCPKDKIRIIPNGVDLMDYKIADDSHGDAVNIGAIVRVVPIKDIATLLYSFAYVKEKNPNVKLFIMGPTDEDGDYYNECVHLADNMAIKDVTFTGIVRIADWIGKMDIIVLTSISEGQPFAILEAMAARKPCVTTDVGSCREMIEGYCEGIASAGIV